MITYYYKSNIHTHGKMFKLFASCHVSEIKQLNVNNTYFIVSIGLNNIAFIAHNKPLKFLEDY